MEREAERGGEKVCKNLPETPENNENNFKNLLS